MIASRSWQCFAPLGARVGVEKRGLERNRGSWRADHSSDRGRTKGPRSTFLAPRTSSSMRPETGTDSTRFTPLFAAILGLVSGLPEALGGHAKGERASEPRGMLLCASHSCPQTAPVILRRHIEAKLRPF